jgi:inosine-uridine nucleoside N-ribohydrolase
LIATLVKFNFQHEILSSTPKGHDDAFAIFLAGYSPKLNLLGISTVHGNQTAEKTTKNALNVLNICGLQNIGICPEFYEIMN